MIQIACPSCGLNLLLPDHLRGQTVPCSGCKGPVDTTDAEKMEMSASAGRSRTTGDDPGDRRSDERDDRPRDERPDDEPAADRPRGPSTLAARVCMIVAGALSIVSGVGFLFYAFYHLNNFSRLGRPEMLVWLVFAFMIVLAVQIVPAIFQFIGAACLGRFEGHGLVVAAAVLALTFGAIQTLFCGMGLLTFIVGSPDRFEDDFAALRLIVPLVVIASGIFNLVAGGLTLGTVFSTAVARIYDRHHRELDRDYDRQRGRGRSRDRDDLRWRRRWD